MLESATLHAAARAPLRARRLPNNLRRSLPTLAPTDMLRLLALPLAIAIAAGCSRRDSLRAPDPAAVTAAPDSFRVAFETSAGRFVVESRRAWGPHGVDRFHYLVRIGFFDDARFFRVLRGFIAQFGIPADPAVARVWRDMNIPDEPARERNVRGTLSYAAAGPGTRTTQLFINLRDNPMLDGMGFAPIGRVVEGMEVVDRLYADYGEGAPDGTGPDQLRIANEGNAYLVREFPRLDRIVKASVIAGW